MTDTKKVVPLFAFYDKTGIEEYLKKQAEEGWLLEKMSELIWQFRKIEPKKIEFSVVYFPKASAFDPKPSESQLSFEEFCEHTGWQLAASKAKLQVYYNEAESPTPIETDAQIQLNNINKAVNGAYLPTWIINIVHGIFQIVLFFYTLHADYFKSVSSSPYMLAGVCWIVMLILAITDAFVYFRWHRKAKKYAEVNDDIISTPRHCFLIPVVILTTFMGMTLLMLHMGGNSMIVWAIMYCVSAIIMTALILFISKLFKRIRMSSKINRALTIVITVLISIGLVVVLLVLAEDTIRVANSRKSDYITYEYKGHTYKAFGDDIPLRIANLRSSDYEEYSTVCAERDSFLINYMKATEEPRWNALEQPELEYTVVTVKVPLLYNMCLKVMLDNFSKNYGYPEPYEADWEQHKEVDATVWGANSAYELVLGGEVQNRYILCYEHCIVEIKFDYDWQPTEEQKAMVGEVLGK